MNRKASSLSTNLLGELSRSCRSGQLLILAILKTLILKLYHLVLLRMLTLQPMLPIVLKMEPLLWEIVKPLGSNHQEFKQPRG
jgi:hypothetical protein